MAKTRSSDVEPAGATLSPDRVVELRRRAAASEQKAKLARELSISRDPLYQYLRTDD